VELNTVDTGWHAQPSVSGWLSNVGFRDHPLEYAELRIFEDM